ncbi:MAG: hypothetical protein L6243_06005 [Candidatus Altiarchaeales archaeon]|nr:hypothetical protein [Candidatus Altiarchaeota archaeon]MBU4266723.1 hypothetical protein [Candidatus Altiarchaeota archaeon]MBU4342041.1 hypothetical protein [Candidatus Altiarchaeota archaeon]MBU4437678.1 hypothetical protein [Candidatus Altiarchaeota archaeon]MCG2783126.1 hypothetical protein [Candidatus Altiarchaeales archaeon]
MKISELILKRMWLENRRFVDSDSLRAMCRELEANYESALRYLLVRKYLVRVFRGIFYVKSPEEVKLGTVEMSHLEMVAKGLKLKGVEKWYFGLHTALRLNNLTHEYFTVDSVINDTIFRANEMKIAGHGFRFVKIKPSLIFGVIERDGIRYSDAEKTILDFLYLGRCRGRPLLDVSELMEKVSKRKLREYARRYPKTMRDMIENERIR